VKNIKESFHIRPATAADAEVIGWHRARMFQDMGQVTPHLFEAFRARSCERLRDLLTRGEYIGWLAGAKDAPERIIAGAGVQFRHALPHPIENATAFGDGRHAIILNVFTEPEWRRHGLAALLLKRIIDWSREQKLDRLVLNASEEARALYERLGFAPTNEMKFIGERK
jgi:GNAT superfamily N-acetyltransferase